MVISSQSSLGYLAVSGLILLSPRIFASSPVQKLRARHDRFNQAAERILFRCESGPHPFDRLVVGKLQTASQGVGEELSTQVVDEIVLSFVAQILAQAFQAVAVLSIGEGRSRFDRLAAQVLCAAFADRAEFLEYQADRVEATVTTGTGLILAVSGEQLRQRQ